MLADFYAECLKLRYQTKTYILVAGHLALALLVGIGLKVGELRHLRRQVQSLGLGLENYMDGLFFARTLIIPTMIILLPVFICTVAGDLLAGEMQDGSLRLYMARPRPRSRVVLAKIGALGVFSFLYCFYCGLSGLLIGSIFFGIPGPQIIPQFGNSMQSDGILLFSLGETLLRYVGTLVYHSFSIMALGCVTLFFSSLYRRMTSATVTGITLYLICYILETMPLISWMRPYLLSKSMNGGYYMWMEMIPRQNIGNSLAVLSIYIILFSSLAIAVFNTKDIE